MIDESRMGGVNMLRESGKTVLECVLNSDGVTMDYACPDCGGTHSYPAGVRPYGLSHKRSSCTNIVNDKDRHIYVFYT